MRRPSVRMVLHVQIYQLYHRQLVRMRKHSKGAIQPKIMSRKGLLAPEGVVAKDMTAIHGLNAL